MTVSRRAQFLLGSCVFTSGACSLGFEVVWAKQLGVVLGGTTAGIAFVVAIFMGGMALGYAVGGRIAARVARPIAAYGVCELSLALLALGAAHLAPALDLLAWSVLSHVAAALLLLPCTFLAGVTLPLLVEGTRGSLGAALGALYGINTLGAVFGVLVTGMFLVGSLGLHGSAGVLATIGVLVGLTAIFADRRGAFSARLGERSDAPLRDAPAVREPRWQSLALAVGFLSLSEEVLWVRCLIPQLNSSTYAFSAILAAFLLGLALGATVAARCLRRGANALSWFCATQLLAGLFVLFSPEALNIAELSLPGYVGMRQVGGISAWLSVVAIIVGRAVASLILPTLMLGFALPLLVELCAVHQSRARVVGTLAGYNTLGSVLGSLAARFLLLPTWGVSGSLRFLAALHALCVVVAALKGAHARHFAGLAAGLALLALLRPTAPPFVGRLAEGHKVVLVDEGVQDTTAVVELRGKGGARLILSNGISYAGDLPEAQRYMRLLGHLPALHAKQQRRGLVICLGTGMTAAALTRHAAFQEIDLVDISPVVFRTLPLFARSNDRVYENPRDRIHIQDGRVFLAHAPAERYDVITLEPPPPRAAGIAALYSREFYQHARRALADGGALAQWLPIHGMTNDELRMLARTFQEVFPDAKLYEIQEVEAALIGIKGEGADAATIAARMAQPAVAEQLRALAVTPPLALPVLSGEALRAALGDGPIVSDDQPRIEHFAAGLPRESKSSTDNAGQLFLREILGPRR
ncbi:MAG TPA: fused MFS/spermidine synthase [Polyangiales bacterium]|nr:fused MFS/spermidine synthase [Polyangiales bacterium]